MLETVIHWFGIVLGSLVGVMLVSVAAWRIYYSVRLLSAFSKTNAEVVRYWITRGEEGEFYHPVLRFRTDNGREILAISSWGSWRRCWRRGQTVAIRYNPDVPQRAEIVRFTNLWGFPATVFALIILAIIVFYWMPKLLGGPQP